MMLKCLFFLIFVLFLKSHADKTAIKNGTKAAERQYPYQASLQYVDGRHFCGASIINQRYLLTAAHCITFRDPNHLSPSLKDVKILRVVVGTNKLDDKNAVTHEIEKIIKNEFFMENMYLPKFADIALVRVTKDIKFNDKVQPILLASSEYMRDYPFEGTSVIITGWGNTHLCMSNSEENTNTLFVAHQIIYDFTKCEKDYTVHLKSKHPKLPHVSLVNRGMMCTIGNEYTCKGDSGGPVVTERGVQVGIVSFGMKYLPEISTNVWLWYEWIIENSNVTTNIIHL